MDFPAYIDPILWLTNQEGLKKSSDILTWTQSYKNIFGVDLCYAGILGLLFAEKGHVTFISQWECSKYSVS